MHFTVKCFQPTIFFILILFPFISDWSPYNAHDKQKKKKKKNRKIEKDDKKYII